MKENGGVVQTVAFSACVNTEKDKKYKNELVKKMVALAEVHGLELKPRTAIRKLKGGAKENAIAVYMKFSKEARTATKFTEFPPVNVVDFVDHTDQLVRKIGIEHVGISSDFDCGGEVDVWNDASETLNITKELVKGTTQKRRQFNFGTAIF